MEKRPLEDYNTKPKTGERVYDSIVISSEPIVIGGVKYYEDGLVRLCKGGSNRSPRIFDRKHIGDMYESVKNNERKTIKNG